MTAICSESQLLLPKISYNNISASHQCIFKFYYDTKDQAGIYEGLFISTIQSLKNCGVFSIAHSDTCNVVIDINGLHKNTVSLVTYHKTALETVKTFGLEYGINPIKLSISLLQ